jgi:ribosomal protein S27AE
MNSNESDFGDSAPDAGDQTAANLIEPLPAVAYDDWDDDEEHDDLATMSMLSHAVSSENDDVTLRNNIQKISQSQKIENSAGGRTPLPPSNAPFEGRSLPSRRSSGGGGGNGRHRCPKCGTSVTFRHGDFEENTYYCATCSGWFLIDSNGDRNKDGNGGPAYEEYMTTNGSEESSNKPQDPQILMHHVSDDFLVARRIPLIPFSSHTY